MFAFHDNTTVGKGRGAQFRQWQKQRPLQIRVTDRPKIINPITKTGPSQDRPISMTPIPILPRTVLSLERPWVWQYPQYSTNSYQTVEMTYIYIYIYTSINEASLDSDNGLSPEWLWAVIWGSFHYWESQLTLGNLTNFWKLANLLSETIPWFKEFVTKWS